MSEAVNGSSTTTTPTATTITPTSTVIPSEEFLTQLTNKWKLDPGKSDSMELMFEFMGVPWLIRKAILAAPPPTMTVDANNIRLRIEQSGLANLVNEYQWNAPSHTHKVPNGEYPAQLEATSNMIRIHVLSMEKGRNIILQYSIETLPSSSGTKIPSLHLIAVITFWIEGKEQKSIRRVFHPKT